MEESITERARQAIAEAVPALRDAPWSPLGRGTDHTAFRVGEYVVRIGAPDETERERALLDIVRSRVTLCVPEPVFAHDGVMIYPLLTGTPLLGQALPPGGAEALGRFIRQLHDVPLARVEGLAPCEPVDPEDWLRDLHGDPELLDQLTAEPPAATTSLVLCHADLGAEHLLSDGRTLTGVIDWSDASLTDPAIDFARIYRDFGPAALEATLEAYGGLPGAFSRIRFFARCAALEDIEWGRTTGDERYVRTAMAALRWLFSE
jgi:aminoglycoside phosphotransferase (APT) family kinase protein